MEEIKAPKGYKYEVVDDTTVRLVKKERLVEFLCDNKWEPEGRWFRELGGADLNNLQNGWVEIKGASFRGAGYRYFANTKFEKFIRRTKK